jgi:hypothetical protein
MKPEPLILRQACRALRVKMIRHDRRVLCTSLQNYVVNKIRIVKSAELGRIKR